MKSFLTAFSILSIVFSLSAQPTIEADDMTPVPGQIISWTQSVEIVPVGVAGQGVIWDYSDLSSFFSNDFSFELIDDQIGADEFPTSTHVLSDPSMETFQYFTFDSDSMSINGIVFDAIEDTVINRLPDPLKFYEFPMQFGDSFSDTYSFQDISSENIGQRVELVSSIDGFGTLVLPSGSVSNVLRIYRTGESELYIYNPEGEILDTVSTVLTQIDFVAAGYQYPLVSYAIQEGDTSISYIANVVTAVEEINTPSYFSLFPNPVSDNFFTLTSEEKIHSIAIFDLTGRLIKSIDDSYFSNSREVRVDCSGLPNGTYMVQVSDKNGYHSLRFVVGN
jgi:hypothetical protein